MGSKVPGMGKGNIGALQNNKPTTPEQVEMSKSVLQFLLDLKIHNPGKPKTPEELEQRFIHYFQKCSTEGLPPTIEGLALVSGWCRSQFYDIAEGKWNQAFSDTIKNAKDYVCSYDSVMAANGKVNAPVYIFRAKNFYDMRDEQKIQVEATPGADKPTNVEDIVNALPEAPNAIEAEVVESDKVIES